MTALVLSELLENGDQQDTLAREVLLVHTRHSGTGTCASCGQAWTCEKAFRAREYVGYWAAERPRLRERYATASS